MEMAGSTDADRVVAALKKVKRKGVVGTLKVNEVNQVVYGKDPAKTGVGLFFQWTEDGARRVVYPPALAEGAIRLPPWMKQ